MKMKCNAAGRALIKDFERYRSTVYPDQAGLPTVGWGHMDRSLVIGTKYSLEQCEQWFEEDIAEAEACANKYVKNATENQFSAFVSQAFNIGAAAFAGSSLWRKHNAGDFAAVVDTMKQWNKVTNPKTKKKEVSSGLNRRRAAEIALYLKDVHAEPEHEVDEEHGEPLPGPQQVFPETISVLKSPQTVIGGLTASGGGLTLAAEASRSVADIRESLGDWMPIIALVGMVCVGGYLIWQAWKKSRG